eukprot:7088714-Pyramimonas_sp.AAC.1
MPRGGMGATGAVIALREGLGFRLPCRGRFAAGKEERPSSTSWTARSCCSWAGDRTRATGSK